MPLDLNALRKLGFSKKQALSLASQFASGGGGFKGQWAAGTYNPGDLVSSGSYLWTPRVTTTAQPSTSQSTLESNPLTTAADWSLNNVATQAAPEVTLINNTGGVNASATLKTAFAVGGSDVSLAAQLYASGGADAIGIGLISAAETNAVTSSNPRGFASLVGMELDIYNNRYNLYTGIGVGAYTSFAATALQTAAYRTVTAKIAGGVLTGTDSYTGATVVFPYQWSIANALAVVWARTGGSSGIFKAQFTSLTKTVSHPDWRRLAALTDLS